MAAGALSDEAAFTLAPITYFMDSEQAHFDAYYYSHGCGAVPYGRTPEWERQFAKIADAIVAELAPEQVLDAGCAMGMLVEALRERGVAAFGVDISEYAIANVAPQARPFCRVGSITEPFGQRYDLIISIEVLEHMPPEQADLAVANLCAHTNSILFSSTPFDYKEATHFNVRPPEAWATLFARHGFYRDVDFDAGFIAPWAVRFVRRTDPPARMVRDYERRFWQLWKESSDLRALVLEQRDALAAADAGLADLRARDSERDRREVIRERTLWALDQRSAELEQAIRRKDEHIAHLENLMRRIESGRVLQTLRGAGQLAQSLRSAGPLATLRGLRGRTGPPAAQPPAPQPLLMPSEDEYRLWVAAHEPGGAELERQRSASVGHTGRNGVRLSFSILTPVLNPPAAALRDTIESVRAQTYAGWELCLADGGSTDPAVRALLAHYRHLDARIKIVLLPENHGISGNSNAALELASGDFVLLLDHDDLLAPNLLFEAAQLLDAEPDTDIIYFDEDKASEDGLLRRSPWFKPASYSPELLLSANYLMHGLFRRALVNEVGGFRPVVDGAQDWDLALRCVERTTRIRHIARVLYHWRQMPGSTSRDAEAKPWALAAQVRSVREHLERRGLADARVELTDQGRVRVGLPCSGARASIIIPTRDRAELLQRCVSSILEKTRYPDIEIVIVDTGSVEPATQALYARLVDEPRVRLLHCSGPFNYSRANNLGARAASGALLIFLNNDTEALEGDWLRELASWTERPEIGAAGAKLLRPDGSIQHSGVVVGLGGHASHVFDEAGEGLFGPFGSTDWYRNYGAVTGACMAMRRDVFEAVNGFDEDYRLVYSDIEICLRIADLGLRVVYTPYARLLHREGASRGKATPPPDVLRGYFHVLGAVRSGDPFYSPLLSSELRIPALPPPEEQGREERLLSILRSHDLLTAAAPLSAPEGADSAPVARRHGLERHRRPARLLVALPDFAPGGSELALAALVGRMLQDDARTEVLVVAPEGGPLLRAYAAAGAEIRLAPGLLDDARVAFGLARECGAVLASGLPAWRAVTAARASGLAALWWLPEPAEQQRAACVASAALADAHASALRLAPGHLEAPAGARLLAWGVGAARPLAGQGGGTDQLQVVCADPIGPGSGPLAVVRAAAQLEGVALQVVGPVQDWALYAELVRAARPYPRIAIAGDLDYDARAALVAAADVLVSTTREPIPFALAQALVAGRAAIATWAGNLGDLAGDRQDGLLVAGSDAGALAARLAQLRDDPGLRAELGAQAQARVAERLDLGRAAAALAALVAESLAGEHEPLLQIARGR